MVNLNKNTYLLRSARRKNPTGDIMISRDLHTKACMVDHCGLLSRNSFVGVYCLMVKMPLLNVRENLKKLLKDTLDRLSVSF